MKGGFAVKSKSTRKCLAGLVFLLATIAFGCAGGGEIQEQISGKWKRTEGGGIVEIQLVKTPKSFVISEKRKSIETMLKVI